MDLSENKEDKNNEQESNKEIRELRNALDDHRKDLTRNDRFEIIVTILLSFATLSSAWCSYQADLWGDKERISIIESMRFEEDANELILESNQIRVAHLNIVSTFIDHYLNDDTLYCKYILAHADSVLKPALLEWVKQRPKYVPEIPNPLKLSVYKNTYEEKIHKFESVSRMKKTESENANEISDKYMLLTVLLSLVLFFSGISGTLSVKSAQILSTVISLIIFIGAVTILISLPVGQS